MGRENHHTTTPLPAARGRDFRRLIHSRLSGSLGVLCSKAAIWGSRREDIRLAPDFSSQKSLTLMMDLSPGGMRKLKQVHRSESATSLGELMVPVRGRSQPFPGGSLTLSLTEQLTPHLCLASQISQEQNFHLALDAGQDEAGPASPFGSRQLALRRDRPPTQLAGHP